MPSEASEKGRGAFRLKRFRQSRLWNFSSSGPAVDALGCGLFSVQILVKIGGTRVVGVSFFPACNGWWCMQEFLHAWVWNLALWLMRVWGSFISPRSPPLSDERRGGKGGDTGTEPLTHNQTEMCCRAWTPTHTTLDADNNQPPNPSPIRTETKVTSVYPVEC